MKRTFTLFTAVLALGLILQSNQSGVAERQGIDATGSPLSNTTCAQCHNGGDFEPEVKIEILNQDSVAVESITPGAKYILRLDVETTAQPGGFGFQAVIMDSLNQPIGEFGPEPGSTQLIDLSNGHTYWEHSTRLSENGWEIEWTADDNMNGNVNVFAVVNAVNGNSQAFDNSDVSATGSLTLNVDRPASIDALVEKLNFVLYPTLVSSSMTVDYDAKLGSLPYKILDFQGKTLQSGLSNPQGEIQLSSFSAGMYFFELETPEGDIVAKFMKQ